MIVLFFNKFVAFWDNKQLGSYELTSEPGKYRGICLIFNIVDYHDNGLVLKRRLMKRNGAEKDLGM